MTYRSSLGFRRGRTYGWERRRWAMTAGRKSTRLPVLPSNLYSLHLDGINDHFDEHYNAPCVLPLSLPLSVQIDQLKNNMINSLNNAFHSGSWLKIELLSLCLTPAHTYQGFKGYDHSPELASVPFNSHPYRACKARHHDVGVFGSGDVQLMDFGSKI